jgi:glycosyltransferase involved in cell wall biosynthesis
VETLLAMGEEIYLGTAGSAMQLSPQVAQRIIKIPLYPSTILNYLRSVSAVRSVVERFSIDIVNSHHRFSTIVANFATMNTGIHVVSSVHELKPPVPLFARKLLGEYSIVFSHAAKDYLCDKYHQPSQKVFVVNPGVTIPIATHQKVNEFTNKFSLNSTSPVIACIARLSYEKGVDIFIEALKIVKNRGYSPQVIIVGDGPAREELVKQSNQNGLDHLVIFVGWIDEVEVIYEISHFLVLPSRSEAFGLVILEGLLFKKPTIASNLGGIKELIKDGETGMLFSPGDISELANKIIKLIETPGLTHKLGNQGYIYVKQKYSHSPW